jgi:hypothetical protein
LILLAIQEKARVAFCLAATWSTSRVIHFRHRKSRCVILLSFRDEVDVARRHARVRRFAGVMRRRRRVDDGACMAGCPSSASFELHCDESADCIGGANTVCCLDGMATQCMGACASGVRLCKTQAECGDAGCALKTCAGRAIQVCGAPPGCR